MRRLIFVLTAGLLLTGGACKRKENVATNIIEEEPAGLASIVHVADPKTAVQLTSGFHELEQSSWRWTMGKFAVALRPPAGAAEKGATLTMKFTMPDPVIEKLKQVVVTATVNGTALPPETYTKSGPYVLQRDVPAAALKGDAISVEYALDHWMEPSPQDARQLGLIVTQIGLEAK